MLKGFILVLVFESSPGVIAIEHMDFAGRATCNAARVMFEAKAEQQRAPEAPAEGQVATPGARQDAKARSGAKLFKLHDAFCVEK